MPSSLSTARRFPLMKKDRGIPPAALHLPDQPLRSGEKTGYGSTGDHHITFAPMMALKPASFWPEP